jgi:DNA-binding NtrC family response regulator
MEARILVVDDEGDLLETLEILLARERLAVTTAASGAAAVDAIRRHRFDAVVTDLRMPGMSGAETISALRAIDPDVPIIVASGCGLDEATADCRGRGACAFIRKPFELEQFLALLRQVLSGRGH